MTSTTRFLNIRAMLIAFTLAIGCTAGAATAQVASEPAPKTAGTRPNIIVILADDLGWGDVGSNGATLIATPNIDRIGREGIRLTNFYAGANVCTPSRAALLTGRYPIRSGMQHVIHPQSDDGLPQSEVTLPEILRDTGYATAMVGKWHLGHRDEYWPTAHGFDEFFGVPYSNDMTPFDLYQHKTVVQSPAEQTELTDRYSSSAVDFIKRNKDGPFFLYYAETFPHLPLFVPDSASSVSEAGLYGDVVEHLDTGVGKILNALDAAGISDNTIVVITSDNGPWFEGDPGSLRDRKGGTHEGSFRVPFLARWPNGIDAGQSSDQMAMNIDFLPTFARLAGAPLPSDRVIDGRDIMPVMAQASTSPHDVLFFFNGNDIAAVRNDRFRLALASYYRTFEVPFERFGIPLLFDLKVDPRERFSYLREHPDIYEQLLSAVEAMRADTIAMRKKPLNPFAPVDNDTVVGPDLHNH